MDEICCELDEKLKIIDKAFQEVEENGNNYSSKLSDLEILLSEFKEKLAKSARALPNYEKQKYFESIKNIEKTINSEKLVCKNIFEDNESEEEQVLEISKPYNFEINSNFSHSGFVEFTNMINEALVIEDYIDSEIFVNGGCESLNIRRVYHSVIFVKGKVFRDVYISDCEDIIIVLVCQQFRVDNSNSLVCYIHTTAENGIAIEDSFGLRFGNFPGCNSNLKVMDFTPVSSEHLKIKNYTIIPQDKCIVSVSVQDSKIDLVYD